MTHCPHPLRVTQGPCGAGAGVSLECAVGVLVRRLVCAVGHSLHLPVEPPEIPDRLMEPFRKLPKAPNLGMAERVCQCGIAFMPRHGLQKWHSPACETTHRNRSRQRKGAAA